MKSLSLLKAAMLGLVMLAGTSQAMARSAAGVAGGYCGEHTRCNCLYNYGDCAWAVHAGSYTGSPSEMPIRITVVNETTLMVEYLRPLTELDDATIDLQADVALPQSICTTLGYSALTILPGSYTLNATGGHGNILFKLKSRK